MIDRTVPRIVAIEQSVAEIFSDSYRLLLPYFQRGYAWRPEHALRLLADIRTGAEGGFDLDWYPLGSIIIARSQGSLEAWVADGHQRLITLTILLALLRDYASDVALKERLAACIVDASQPSAPAYRMTTSEQASECLQRYVQESGATRREYEESGDELSESEENIIANRDSLRREVLDLSEAQRRTLSTYLLDCCLMLVKSVRDQRVAQFLFSTMHDAGLRPTGVDLFKAEILGRVRIPNRERCQSAWEGLEARIGQSGLDKLLKHIVEIEAREAPKEHIPTMLRSRFGLSEPAAAESFVEDTLRRIGRIFASVLEVPFRTIDYPPAVSRRLQYLSWVRNHDTWMVPVLHWIDRHGIEHDDTLVFLRRLEAFAWMQMICAVEPPQRHQRYMRILGEIDRGDVLSERSVLAISREEERKIRSTLASPNYTNRSYKLFLLLRANAAIEGDDHVSFTPEATIEHIYPRNPASGSRWATDFNQPKRAAQLRNSLGNLTLLTRSEQDRTKNLDFANKREVLRSSVFALSRRLADRQTWRPDDVEANAEEVIKILFRSWGLA